MRIRQSGGNKFKCLERSGKTTEFTKDESLLNDIGTKYMKEATSTKINVHIKFRKVSSTNSTMTINKISLNPNQMTYSTTTNSTTISTTTDIETVQIPKDSEEMYHSLDTNRIFHGFSRDELHGIYVKFIKQADDGYSVDLRPCGEDRTLLN